MYFMSKKLTMKESRGIYWYFLRKGGAKIRRIVLDNKA